MIKIEHQLFLDFSVLWFEIYDCVDKSCLAMCMTNKMCSGGAMGGDWGDSFPPPPILKSRQKFSMKNGIKLVGYTFRLRNYVKIPPISLRFFRAGAATEDVGMSASFFVLDQVIMLYDVNTVFVTQFLLL